MKKQLLLFTFSLFLIPFSFSQDYSWKNINNNVPGTPDLSDVFFVSDDEGWITSSSHAEIYHTIDGGETFEIQTTQYTCEAIYMVNENEGYAGGENGRVYKTTDGGENWVALGSIGVTLTDITFPPNSDTGYACGLSGQIFTVNQSGITQMNSNAGTVNLKSLIFPTKEEGWVCGESLILHFMNDTWNADQLYPSGSYNAIYFEDNTKGWAAGDNGLILHTGNGGANWSTQNNSDPRSLFNIFFISMMEGWAIGIDNIILHTTNGGTTWIVEGAGLTTAFLRGVHFTSPTNGYAVGNEKTLLKYTTVSGIEEEASAIEFEVFPNPCTDKIQITNFKIQKNSKLQTSNSKLEIIDLHGKVVYEEQMGRRGDREICVDVSDLQSGVYLCKITIDNRSSTKKLIKE